MCRLYEAQQKFKKVEHFYSEVKKKEQLAISNFMYQFCGKDEKSFTVDLTEGENYYTDHKRICVTKARRQKVLFDLARLKSKLSKKKYLSIVNREYVITDYEGLTGLLKKYGVSANEFKKFVCVNDTLDETKLEIASGTGAIKQSELKGCYTIESGEPYIQLREVKR